MKIKTPKLIITAFTALTLFINNTANAQSTTKSNLRFGIGIDGLLPVGAYTSSTNFVLGVTPRLQYGISDKVALTFTSGIYHFFTKTVTYPASGPLAGGSYKPKSDIIPIKAGVKFFAGSNIYLGAEAGAGFQVADGGGPVSLLASPTVGYAVKHWDIGVRYENFSGNGSSAGLIGLRLAHGFGL